MQSATPHAASQQRPKRQQNSRADFWLSDVDFLDSASVILGGLEPPISSVSGRRPEPLGHRIVWSTPARIRTWNAAFEARNDGPFHHQGISDGRYRVPQPGVEPGPPPSESGMIPFHYRGVLTNERRGRDSNPHALAGARVSTAARPAVSVSRPYSEWTRRELNPDCRYAIPASSP